MPSCHLILCHPLLLLPSIPPSIRVFSNESTLRMRWPKYWSFSFSIIPSRADLLQNGLVGSPCSPRDSQEASPAPQFKSINSSAHLPNPIEYVTLRVNPKVNYGLWLIMMYQCRFILGKKCTVLVSDVDNRESNAC